MRLAITTDDPLTGEAAARTAGRPNGWFDRAKGMLCARFDRACERRMELIEKLELGSRRQLMLIVCDGREYLVGAGADGIHAITEVGIKAEPSQNTAEGARCTR